MNIPMSIGQIYKRDGFVSPVRLIGEDRAAECRAVMQHLEAEHGPLHYLSKVHTILDFVGEIATDPAVLDVVEQMIGSDILLYDCTFIVKEPHSAAHVSWHQDLTYWGLVNDEQVSMWLALSPATQRSGCMRMIPQSHKKGRMQHADRNDPENVLHRGQTVDGVDESEAVLCPLASGEASFHHGWTLHASLPNQSDDRRIGLNVQYISAANRNSHDPNATATLVRGKDDYNHYAPDRFASGRMLADDLAWHADLERRMKETWSNA